MTANLEGLRESVVDICKRCDNDRTRMVDIVRAVQKKFGYVPGEAMEIIAEQISAYRVEVENVVTFYAFLSTEPKGKVVIRLCDDIIDRMVGLQEIEEAFTRELGIKVGETTQDSVFTLEYTPCIGMSDQAPAALINNVIVTDLTAEKVKKIVGILRDTEDPQALVTHYGEGNNSHRLVTSMVNNNIKREGEVIFSEYSRGKSLKQALAMSPMEVIRSIKAARLRGRGGAGFPTGMKWEFTRSAEGEDKTILCNADEGEPGTFKDRVLLTEYPDLLIEGMTISAYAIGAERGIIYLREEYAYLKDYLEEKLAKQREENLLGNDILGKKGFNFDIRIQMGAGAYVCGEETALISSCEGIRGDPKNRPPFPAQRGYLGTPTLVNNVETFDCIVHIIERGAGWFASIGSRDSTGTKLFSVCGDCKNPGVFEFPFGISLRELLKAAGAENTKAVQVGGPSGTLVGEEDFDRRLGYEDLATGGSIMVFNKDRSVLEIIDYFMDFFIDESCGYCTPCRVGNVLLKERLKSIINGRGEPSDIDYLKDISDTMIKASRCGLGQTAPNPILSLLNNFSSEYKNLLREKDSKYNPSFDVKEALAESEKIAGRESVVY